MYISKLDGVDFAGPTHSVPRQIEAQSIYDDVFWYNFSCLGKEEWKLYGFYHNLVDFPQGSLDSLPKPFNRPDLIVVEQFYNLVRNHIWKEIIQSGVPYIIIPRGEFTNKAQKRKMLKKYLANILLCKKYYRNASAIHYLTTQEYNDSSNKWNTNFVIIPNGIGKPGITKKVFHDNCISFVYIGRIEPYQKGLDLLLNACFLIKDYLKANNAFIEIYGPDTDRKIDKIKRSIKKYDLEKIVFLKDGVYGDAKKQVLLESDIFIMPSRFEGHPMALIEALSYGLPCIVSKGSNLKYEVEKSNAGWSFESTSEELAQAMLSCINSKNSFSRFSDNAIRLSDEYSWKTIAKKSHEAYLKVLEN